MANVTTFLDNSLPQTNRSVRGFRRVIPVVNNTAAANDFIQVFTFGPNTQQTILSASLTFDQPLGASVVLGLVLNRGGTRTALTTTTTANASNGKVNSSTIPGVPFEVVAGDILEIAVTAAPIGSTANLGVELLLVQR